MHPLLLAIKNSVLRIFSDEIHSDNHVISNCICCVIAEPSIEADENFSRVADDTTINVDAQGPVKFSVWVSFAEIYNETIYDLLEPCPQGKGKKRTTLRLGDDSNGNPYIKGGFIDFFPTNN